MTDKEFAELREQHIAYKAAKKAEEKRIREQQRKEFIESSDYQYFLKKMRSRITIQAGDKI